MRVVIADDSTLMREGVAAILRRAGIDVAAQAASRRGAAARGRPSTSPTWRSSTSGCRRRSPTKGCARRTSSAPGTRGWAIVILSQHVETGTATRLLAEDPGGSATCSRTASETSRSSPARCGAWPPAAPRWTRRWSRGCWRARATTARWPRSARASARCSSWSPRVARTRRSATRLELSLRGVQKHVTAVFTQARPRRRTRTTTAASWPSSSTSGSRVRRPPRAENRPGPVPIRAPAHACPTPYLATPAGWDLHVPCKRSSSQTSLRTPDAGRRSAPATSSAATARATPPSTRCAACRVDIAAGRLTAVMGPSGSGKSTLMHILAGLDKPTAGEVTVAGVDIAGLDDTALTMLRRDHIGFIFQFFNLLPMLTAAENIALPLKLAGQQAGPGVARGGDRHRRPRASGSRTARPSSPAASSSASRWPARWSRDRRVMFADEPTGNLDSTTSGEILGLLRNSVDQLGQTTVMVTHDAHAAAIADRVLFLADGDIVRDLGRSTAHEILETLEEVSGSMIGVALKGLAGRKVRALLTALGDRHRRLDGQRHVHPHRHDAEVVQRPLHRDVGQHRRRHHAARRSSRTPPAAAASRSRQRCSRRSGRCPRSRRPRATSTRAEANVADIIGKDGKAVAKESVGGSYDAANARFSPFRFKTGKPPQGPEEVAIDAGTATKHHYKVGDSVVVSTLGKQHTYRITGTMSFGSVDSLGFASIAAWDVKTAQALLNREGRYDGDLRRREARHVSRAARAGDQAASARRPAGQGQRRAGQGEREGPQRRHGDDPLGAARLRRDRAARRRVRDLQHPVDHGRPAHARVRDAADARRLAQAGHALGAARGPDDRPARLGDRARRWASPSPRAWSRCSACSALELPDGGTVIATHTITTSLIVGTGVTLLASILPARRATRVPPIAAVREGAVLPDDAVRGAFRQGGSRRAARVAAVDHRGDVRQRGERRARRCAARRPACSACSWALRCWRRGS